MQGWVDGGRAPSGRMREGEGRFGSIKRQNDVGRVLAGVVPGRVERGKEALSCPAASGEISLFILAPPSDSSCCIYLG